MAATSDVVLPRPSSAHRWIACPGSVRAESHYPESDTAAAEKGTHLHELAGEYLISDLVTLRKGELRELLCAPDEDIDIIEPYVLDVLQVAGMDGELYVEDLIDWRDRQELKGTPDAYVIDHKAKRIIIWDLKTGWTIVEVWMNWQLICYAVMILSHFEDLGEGWTIDLRVVQVNGYHKDGAVRQWTLDWEELQAYQRTLGDALTVAMHEGAMLRPGRQCVWCQARVGCRAARTVTLATIEFASRERVHIPNEHIGQELEILRSTLQILKLRTEALEEEVTVRLKSGARINGLALGEARGGRTKWTEGDAQVKEALQMFTGEDHSRVKMPTPKQLIASGVDEELVKSLTYYQPGKLRIVTDALERTQKMFASEPDTTHATPKETP